VRSWLKARCGDHNPMRLCRGSQYHRPNAVDSQFANSAERAWLPGCRVNTTGWDFRCTLTGLVGDALGHNKDLGVAEATCGPRAPSGGDRFRSVPNVTFSGGYTRNWTPGQLPWRRFRDREFDAAQAIRLGFGNWICFGRVSATSKRRVPTWV